jgi:hypothetical protein
MTKDALTLAEQVLGKEHPDTPQTNGRFCELIRRGGDNSQTSAGRKRQTVRQEAPANSLSAKQP